MQNKLYNILKRISVVKTIRFNLRYLPIKQAVRIPIIVARKVRISNLKGKIIIYNKETASIRIGFGSFGIGDFKYERSIWDVSGTVIFNGKASFGHGSRIAVQKKGTFIVGDGSNITGNSSIVVEKSVALGNNSIIAWDTLIMDSDFHKIENNDGNVINQTKPIKIGNNVWIGCRCTILKGSIIPDGCVIAAGSVVSGQLSLDKSIYGNNKLRLIKENINWIR